MILLTLCFSEFEWEVQTSLLALINLQHPPPPKEKYYENCYVLDMGFRICNCCSNVV